MTQQSPAASALMAAAARRNPDPQAAAGRGRWMAHDGPIWIEDMPDEYLLNAYKTCLRHDNPKAGELLDEIEARNLDWRLM